MYRAVVRILLCSETLLKISAQYFLMYVQSGLGLDRLIANSGGGQERHFKGGSQQISVKLREKIGVERVLLNKPVSLINWDEAKTAALVGKEADDVDAGVDPMSTPPPPSVTRHLQRRLDLPLLAGSFVALAPCPVFVHPLRTLPTAEVKQLLGRMYMGNVIKTVTRYKRPFWKEMGYKGTRCGLPFPRIQHTPPHY